MGVEIAIAIVAGLIVGSFLNVCIFRIPLDLSVVRPGSSCPHCGAAIRWYDNVPVIGFLRLSGRCRDCSERISLRYPAVEILTATTFVAIELAGFAPHVTFLYWALASAYIVIAVIVAPGALILWICNPETSPLPSVPSALFHHRALGEVASSNDVFGPVPPE